jgi:hypothetical protein
MSLSALTHFTYSMLLYIRSQTATHIRFHLLRRKLLVCSNRSDCPLLPYATAPRNLVLSRVTTQRLQEAGFLFSPLCFHCFSYSQRLASRLFSKTAHILGGQIPTQILSAGFLNRREVIEKCLNLSQNTNVKQMDLFSVWTKEKSKLKHGFKQNKL